MDFLYAFSALLCDSVINRICIFGVSLPDIRQSEMFKMHAVALGEASAATASIQRHLPGQPPVNFVNSAASPVLPASHFSGLIA
ncbi:MAG: hypothetical protein GC179_28420 [Anaerolineaceae bacterium]|nr:hypothetical protein [Anaerolineaceae bacterium]